VDVRRRGVAILIGCLFVSSCTILPRTSTGPTQHTALQLMFDNRYSAATAELGSHLQSNPNDAEAYADYALVLNYETKLKQALTEARRALSLAPHDGYVLTVLTRVEDWNTDLPAAVQDGAAAIKAVPTSSLAHSFYAEALADSGKYTQAQAELAKAASLAASGTAYEKAETQRNWANYYSDRKDWANALASFKRAAGDQPNWVERVLELARFSINRDDLSGATTYLQRAVVLSPDDAGLREQLGDVALFAQDYAVAKDAYSAALKLQPRSSPDLSILGDIAVALDHDPATGAADERAALRAEPTNVDAGNYLVAILRYLNGDQAGANAAATSSVAPPPGQGAAGAYINLDALSQSRQGTALAAVNRYRAIALLPPVTASAVIHQSALSHAFYTLFNGADPKLRDLGIHHEVAGDLAYTGDNVLTRAEHFGYPARSMAEVITHKSDPQSAVDDWIDSVFHRIPLLRGDLLELGFGDAYLGSLDVQVMDMAYREAGTTGRVIVYPAKDQTDVPTSFFGNEIPDPAPNAAYPIGFPITAIFDRFAAVHIGGYRLTDAAGTSLPGIGLTPDNPEMENSFAFMASSPLQPGATYTMDLSGTINGVPFHKVWSFTTAGAAAPSGGVIAVDLAASLSGPR
jgi:tetratricopeptide (TPR) repeat protein